MVISITSLTGNGLKDWLIQRFSALIFGVYSIFIIAWLCMHPGLNYDAWSQFAHNPAIKIATILTLLSYVLHSWIGIWTVTTDYLKCTILRLMIQGLVIIILFVEAVWGIMLCSQQLDFGRGANEQAAAVMSSYNEDGERVCNKAENSRAKSKVWGHV